MIITIAINFLGVIFFLFSFWKRLKEDYASEIIFKSGFSILTGIILGWLVSLRFFSSWFLFAELIGALIGIYISFLRFRMRFYEILEAFVSGILPWLAIFFLTDSVINFSLSSFLGFLGILVYIFIFYFLDMHYKSFTWYKSGKVGFASLSTLGTIFIVRSLLATFGVSMLSFVSSGEAIVSGVFAFLSFLALYNLGREQ